MSEEKDRKVIPLKLKQRAPTRRDILATDLKATAAGAMAFVLLLVVSFNFSVFQKDTEVQRRTKLARGLASLSKQEDVQPTAIPEIKREMVVQMAQRPSATESLVFGPLAGKYSIVTDHGYVKKIALNENSEQATQVSDRLEFIETHSSALVPGLSSIRKLSVQKSPEGKKEVYEVKSQAGESRIEFTIGQQNQLISLTVE